MLKKGTYVTFTINSLATIEDVYDDPIAYKAAIRQRNKQYVGYVLESHSPSNDGYPWKSYTIIPLAPKLPVADEEEHISPTMCTPVVPTKPRRHPTSRPALTPSKPLPFRRCFH
ncbi:hypothetical protein BDN72DRAFT_776523, partial [Pluteus cervinus]